MRRPSIRRIRRLRKEMRRKRKLEKYVEDYARKITPMIFKRSPLMERLMKGKTRDE